MSIFDYLFDSEWSQRSDIEDLKARSRRQQQAASNTVSRTSSKVRTLETQVQDLKEEIGSLQLITRTLLRTLQSSPSWDEDAFKKLLMEIDLEDGIQDGKAPAP